jgi:hypothetical protein
MDWIDLAFNSCAFIASACLLNYGNGLFLTNTTLLFLRAGIPEVLTTLLTVGSEWEIVCFVSSRNLSSVFTAAIPR